MDRLTYSLDDNSCRPSVLNNQDICGTKFMQSFLENLMKYDKQASKDMKYKIYQWKEKDQKSPKNNKYILMALADTIKAYKIHDKELKKFLHLLNSFIKHNKFPNIP